MGYDILIGGLFGVVLSLLAFPGVRELVIGPAVDALINLTSFETIISQ